MAEPASTVAVRSGTPPPESAPGPLPLYRVLAEEYDHQHPGSSVLAQLEKRRREIEPKLAAEVEKEVREQAERARQVREQKRADQVRRTGAKIAAPSGKRRQGEEQELAREIEEELAQRLDSQLVGEFYQWLHEHGVPRAALCFSGGGIRSATFGLGVLQGLARRNLLGKFDYLSTVSGGGYLGSWLTAWLHRARGGLQEVEHGLASPTGNPLCPEPDPIRHLRSYSRYMSPKMGFLSADTWTLIAIFFRNLILNWLVLLPLLAAGLVIPRLGALLVRHPPQPSWQWVVFWAAVLAGSLSIAYIIANRPSLADKSGYPEKRRGQLAFLRWCLLPLALMAVAITIFWAWIGIPIDHVEFQILGFPLDAFWAFLLFGVLLHFGGFLISRLWVHTVASGELVINVLTGALGGILTWVAAKLLFPVVSPTEDPALYLCFASPLLLGLFLLATTLFVGLASHYTDDADREWLARAGGWILIAIVVRAAIYVLVVFGPLLLARLPEALASIGGVSGLLTLWLGQSSMTAAKEKQAETAEKADASKVSTVANVVLALAAPIFILTLVAALALGTTYLIKGLVGLFAPGFQWPPAQLPYDPLGLISALFNSPWWAVLGVMVALAFVGGLMGRFVDINRFSLHGAYRDRLIRAYLGASRLPGERRPNPFTGFDDNDNEEMHKLVALRRPLHVVNIALNLVAGKNLAWQDRKAESFTVSALHAGSHRLGYRDAEQYGLHFDKSRAISLGTAVAVSGAAASPNMGYHSSPVVTFLLALFNVRLGWWLGNPGKAGEHTYQTPGPRFAPRPLLAEAFGLTDDQHPYVYLSDGGHFENLAFYEMVLRRCRYIVVSDGEQDGEFRFEGLANAIGKIRTDLGVPIFFQKILMQPRDPDRAYDLTRSEALRPYCAVGRICYSCVDGSKPENDGLLLYIKASLNGTEPVDVYNYAKVHPDFPHESTGDQLYSESQFESYRALGSHAANQILKDVPAGSDLATLFEVVQKEPVGKAPGCEDALPPPAAGSPPAGLTPPGAAPSGPGGA